MKEIEELLESLQWINVERSDTNIMGSEIVQQILSRFDKLQKENDLLTKALKDMQEKYEKLGQEL